MKRILIIVSFFAIFCSCDVFEYMDDVEEVSSQLEEIEGYVKQYYDGGFDYYFVQNISIIENDNVYAYDIDDNQIFNFNCELITLNTYYAYNIDNEFFVRFYYDDKIVDYVLAYKILYFDENTIIVYTQSFIIIMRGKWCITDLKNNIILNS